MGRKILILAGSFFQIPVIEYAISRGHHVITCDNMPDNPGHKLANQYFNVSTTDLDGILEVAVQNKIDGILAYGSDPAAPTAAYVSQKLNLPGNSYESIITLSNKSLFRSFQFKYGFPTPRFLTMTDFRRGREFLADYKGDLFVKPVDSSGSKGITRVRDRNKLESAFDYAMNYSRSKEVIIEEEILKNGPHIHGEVFVFEGEIKFLLVGDQYFSNVNSCAPLSTTLPSIEHTGFVNAVFSNLEILLKQVGFLTGGLNIEVIRGLDDTIWFVEIGARNGGNLMPELVRLSSGFDLAKANVDVCLGERPEFPCFEGQAEYCTQVILHSERRGRLVGIDIPEKYLRSVKVRFDRISKGDQAEAYKGSQDVVGVYLFKFEKIEECRDFIDYIKHHKLLIIR